MKCIRFFPLLPVLAGVSISALFLSSGLGEPGRANSLPVGLSKSEWEAIRSDVDAGRHRFEAPDDGTWVVRNPGQQWHTVFDGEGFLTRPNAGCWEWGLSLRSLTSGDVLRSLSNVITKKCVTGNRLDLCRGEGLTEWFVNDSRGLEQGWTFAYAPEPGAATIRMELAIRGGLRPEVSEREVAFRNEAGAAVLTYGGLKAWDADGKAVPVRFAEVGDEAFAVEAYVRGARYPVTIDPIAQQAFLKASNTGNSDHFGYSVAVSGDTLVVGAPGEASPATGVNGDGSGNGLTESGAAYVFVRSGGAWVQQAYLKASNSGMLDGFGAAVAISGDTIVVGAPGEDSAATGVNGDELDNTEGSSGTVYVFVRSGNQWSKQAYLKASNTEDSDQFGISVGISGETVVVGAELEDGGAGGINGDETDNNMGGAGAAYVFVRSRGKWSQQAYLKAAVPGAGDHFGHKVAISGESIIVGALNEDSGAIGIDGDGTNDDGPESGAAYVFVRSKGKWSQQAYLKASNADFYDEFGCSVAISGDTAVVGARGEDSSANRSISEGSSPANDFQNAGAAYVFFRTGTAWVEQAYLKPLKPEAGDFFGSAVAVSGDLVVVGAPLESSDATGVNGSDNNANAGYSGAAYAFSRMGWQWWQVAYLKSSNTGANDGLGTAVALSGQTAIVGAHLEGSDAIGVNGNGNNNNAPGSGAAYVYTFGPNFRSLSHRQFRAPGEADLYYGIEGQAAIGDGAGVIFESGVTGVGATRGRYRATFSNFGASGEVDLLLQRYSLLSGVGSLPTGAKVTTMNNLVAHQWRRGLFLATVAGGGVNATNNRVLFRDNGSFLVPLCRTGDEIAELGGAKPNVFKELGQHASDNALALSYTLARNTTLGVTLANDSGLLFLNHGGNVIGSMPREGDADGSGGVFGQLIGKAAIHDGPQAFFIAKSIPVTGAAIDRAYWTRHDTNSAPVPFLVAGGVAADGAALGATFRTLLATNGDAGAGTVRATLTGAPSTANEGIWVDSGPLLMLEGTEIYPMFQPGVAISRFVRYWAVGSDQILAQVILRGPGVKSTNNQALLLLENRRLLVLMRTGDRAPGFDKSTVTVGAISAVDLDPVNGHYVILGTLRGKPSNENQALWAGTTLSGDDSSDAFLRVPQLLLQKGQTYSTDGVTPRGVIRGMALKSAVETSGAGGRGLGQVINSDARIVITVIGDGKSRELVILNTGNIVVAPPSAS